MESGTKVWVIPEQRWGVISASRYKSGIGRIYKISGIEPGEFDRDELQTELQFNFAMATELKAALKEHEANEPEDPIKRLGHWWSLRNKLVDSISFYESNVLRLSGNSVNQLIGWRIQ